MALDISKSIDIIETMENYISKVRPPVNIRHQLDIGYEIADQSIILQEIRPSFKDPNEMMRSPYAKTTFVKNKNIWKVFWMRADLNWHSYKPTPFVGQLSDFLRLVDEDKYACFKG
jgi:ABC-type cobalamin/Fe3+-siderophores transport system ATPase subunit